MLNQKVIFFVLKDVDVMVEHHNYQSINNLLPNDKYDIWEIPRHYPSPIDKLNRRPM